MTSPLRSSTVSIVRKSLAILLCATVMVWMVAKVSVPFMETYLIIQKPLNHADALVVMAGNEMKVRGRAAANLYKQGVAATILLTNDGIFSAWSEEKQRNLYHVEWAEEDLLQLRIPVDAIRKLSYSSSGTIHDALNTRMAVAKQGYKKIIIVTSDYHTRRSLWTFERVFAGYPVEIGVYPVKSELVARPYLSRFRYLSQEMIKYVYYFCKYGS